MARYDSQGYRSDGRRQILGYSRLAQGGADQARARAEERVAMSRDPSLMAARRRSRRVADAKEEGSFDDIQDAYNDEGQAAGVEMDNAGTIRQKPKSILKVKTQYTPTPAPNRPLDYSRPAGQRIADVVSDASNMSKSEGLLDMAKKARRRNTYVIP